jgi:hypothetical protein
MPDKQWSKELQQYTLELLDRATFGVNPLTQEVCFKHINGGYGFVEARHAIDERYIMHVRGSDQIVEFPDSISLVRAGWALD